MERGKSARSSLALTGNMWNEDLGLECQSCMERLLLICKSACQRGDAQSCVIKTQECAGFCSSRSVEQVTGQTNTTLGEDGESVGTSLEIYSNMHKYFYCISLKH